MKHLSCLCFFAFICIALMAAACGLPGLKKSAVERRVNTPLALPGLDQPMCVAEGIYCGSEPKGDAGFDSLAQLGIKTIVSVDGARPDIARSRARGIAYVHLPCLYSGIAPEVQAGLERVALERPQPMYVHCHHGCHRGPVAAAIIAMKLRLMTRDEGLALLKLAKTGENYKGLWTTAREYKPLDMETVQRAELPETVASLSMAGAMAEVSRTWERLQAVKEAAWVAPKDHPDIDPAHEALMLFEGLTEIARFAAKERAGVQMDFKDCLASAADLRDSLAKKDASAAEKAYNVVAENCKGCHQKYRDN